MPNTRTGRKEGRRARGGGGGGGGGVGNVTSMVET